MPKRISTVEFVAGMAMLFAILAFSTDSMLPALPEIAGVLSPEAPNRAQLIVTSFILGLGIGTLFTGPLSDAFGRRPVILGGIALYAVAAFAAWIAPTLETILFARVFQGIGAAGPRVVALAIIRDLFEGRRMAQIMSLVMMVFTLVPAVAPLIGVVIIEAAGWRSIFLAFLVFALPTSIWFYTRQTETLPPEKRIPFRLSTLRAGIIETFSIRMVVLTMCVLSLVFGALFSQISSIQPIFDKTFGAAESFPKWFALIALVSALGSILNARIVMTFGMRRVILVSLLGHALVTVVIVALSLADVWASPIAFGLFIAWCSGTFFMAGLTIGNLNALAMVPLGHIAGMAASILGAVSTVAAVAIAAPVSLAFNGTPFPLALGVLICTGLGYLITRQLGDVASEDVSKTA